MRTMKEVGAHLRELRKSCGLSLPKAAERAGMAHVVIGSDERGDRRPSIDQLARLYAAYGHEIIAVPVGSTVVPPGVPVRDVVMTDDQLADALRGIADRVQARLPMLDAAELAALRAQLVKQRDGGAS